MEDRQKKVAAFAADAAWQQARAASEQKGPLVAKVPTSDSLLASGVRVTTPLSNVIDWG